MQRLRQLVQQAGRPGPPAKVRTNLTQDDMPIARAP